MILTAAPKKQRNHKYINDSVDQWIDIHFGDTTFNGRVVLGHRKPGSGGIYPMSVRNLTELRPYVKMIHASPRLDYYITANTVSGVNRRKEDLFGLQNIVIDVDCHEDRQPQHVMSLVQAFIWRSKRDLWDGGIIPTPNSIVHTGRGIQLWWAIIPCFGGRGYDKSRYHYDKIKTTFMDYIDMMLDEYSEELDGLSVDRGASSNPVGYFRLPCTYNTKAKCFGALKILHGKRYDQRELTKIESPVIGTRSEVAHSKPRFIPMLESDRFVLSDFHATGARRVIQLIKLRNLRDNETGSEQRDYFNFSVYNALRMSFDHNHAMVRLRAFNSGFKKPMNQRELENCISTASAKGGYKYTNSKLIELLEISPEEQEAIGLFPYTQKRRSKPNASRDAVRKALREDRDNKILELIEKGTSQAETARILGIGKNTVGRVLKRLRETDVIEVVEPKIEQNSRHQFGSIYVLNSSASQGAIENNSNSKSAQLLSNNADTRSTPIPPGRLVDVKGGYSWWLQEEDSS